MQRERSDDESGGDQGNDLQFWPTSRDPGSQFPAYQKKNKERKDHTIKKNAKFAPKK